LHNEVASRRPWPLEWITASGDWTNDRTHGQQFKARFLKTSAPTSLEGIEKYLASGMIRGIGPVYANYRKNVRCVAAQLGDAPNFEKRTRALARSMRASGPIAATRPLGLRRTIDYPKAYPRQL
jgi:exodeoxyribonuclease V alpha subunit